MTTNTQSILSSREKTHGNFKCQSATSHAIKQAIANADHRLAYYQREALDMIAVKMSRILNGNPDERDHWEDIIGYATLVLNNLPTEKKDKRHIWFCADCGLPVEEGHVRCGECCQDLLKKKNPSDKSFMLSPDGVSDEN